MRALICEHSITFTSTREQQREQLFLDGCFKCGWDVGVGGLAFLLCWYTIFVLLLLLLLLFDCMWLTAAHKHEFIYSLGGLSVYEDCAQSVNDYWILNVNALQPTVDFYIASTVMHFCEPQ